MRRKPRSSNNNRNPHKSRNSGNPHGPSERTLTMPVGGCTMAAWTRIWPEECGIDRRRAVRHGRPSTTVDRPMVDWKAVRRWLVLEGYLPRSMKEFR